MIKAVDIRKGKCILHKGDLYIVHEASHVAKGNKRSYMQTKLKNMKTGVINEVRFSVNDRIEIPYVETKTYEYLYPEAGSFVMMDPETFDQITVSADIAGDAVKFMAPNVTVTCEIYDGKMISFELPHVVELTIKETPPVVKGSTVTNQPKEAILETGAKVRVPAFIESGERIRIDTRTGEYMERAK